eukprot:121964-Chlamydomonas_euryale.AAC.1
MSTGKGLGSCDENRDCGDECSADVADCTEAESELAPVSSLKSMVLVAEDLNTWPTSGAPPIPLSSFLFQ